MKSNFIKRAFTAFGFFFLLSAALNASAARTTIPAPAGSGSFGGQTIFLPNGNFVVTDTGFDENSINNLGAVHLYNGATLARISTLKGATENDLSGVSITVLPNGNFVVRSALFNGGATADVGAVTFCSGTTGCTAAVSAVNSLVGSTADDRVGDAVTVLTNGNYVVNSPNWDDGATANVGAVTFCSGANGCGGAAVGKTNSLVGSSANNFLGNAEAIALPNGNYAVQSSRLTNSLNRDVEGIGFVPVLTYGNGIGGIIGTPNEANSLIGVNEIFNTGEVTFNFDPVRRRILLGKSTGNSVLLGSFPAQFDFGTDSRAEIGVFRPSNGGWFTFNLTNGENTSLAFGQASDIIVPADYDGDMKTDHAVYRGGTWFLQRSALGFTGIGFGAGSDIPAPADFDGDGRSELAVFRPSTGAWFTLNLATGAVNGLAFGANGDRPVPADYDGDARADIAVYRSGSWFIQRSSLGFTALGFGDGNDRTVPADYDADGIADIAVFRPANGTWFLLRSRLGFTGIGFGQSGDAPAPADYDGDQRTDLAVFRQGTWFIQRSTLGFTGAAFGATTDLAVPNAFVR